MKKSIVYARVKLTIDHEDDVDPMDIIAETDYDFHYSDGKNEILNTEIVGADVTKTTEF